ncbi:MAG: plasmid stabilization protein [Pseudomonadota bacterium]
MPKGSKDAYTDKQKRKAEHIEEGYEARGLDPKEAERRAWATVNKDSGGGNQSGSGRGKPDTNASAHEGGKSAAGRAASSRSAAAERGAETRKRRAAEKTAG